MDFYNFQIIILFPINVFLFQLAAYGKNREEALNTMDKALDSYVIRGLAHNISLLRDVVDNARFREGKISTAFLPREYPEGFSGII